MRVTEWAASGDAGRARLVWIDIDARTEKPDPDAVCAEIERILGDPRFDHRWVRDDLLHPDNAPEVRSLADGQVRKVSAVGATIAGGGREPEGRVRLAFELVEMLASDRWMVTCWHHSRVYTGAFGDQEEVHQARDRALARVDERRLTEEGATVGDLGILILHELALTYREARKRLHACVDYWDLRFFRDHETDEPALIDLRALVGEFSKRVEGLNLPRSEVEQGWFSDVSQVKRAEAVDELIDRARHDLDALKETLRSSFEAVRLAHSERLQRGLERVTAILLVPTLIAGFYGANTALPGGNHWTGFVIMLALMALGAGTSYALLVRARRRRG